MAAGEVLLNEFGKAIIDSGSDAGKIMLASSTATTECCPTIKSYQLVISGMSVAADIPGTYVTIVNPNRTYCSDGGAYQYGAGYSGYELAAPPFGLPFVIFTAGVFASPTTGYVRVGIIDSVGPKYTFLSQDILSATFNAMVDGDTIAVTNANGSDPYWTGGTAVVTARANACCHCLNQMLDYEYDEEGGSDTITLSFDYPDCYGQDYDGNYVTIITGGGAPSGDLISTTPNLFLTSSTINFTAPPNSQNITRNDYLLLGANEASVYYPVYDNKYDVVNGYEVPIAVIIRDNGDFNPINPDNAVGASPAHLNDPKNPNNLTLPATGPAPTTGIIVFDVIGSATIWNVSATGCTVTPTSGVGGGTITLSYTTIPFPYNYSKGMVGVAGIIGGQPSLYYQLPYTNYPQQPAFTITYNNACDGTGTVHMTYTEANGYWKNSSDTWAMYGDPVNGGLTINSNSGTNYNLTTATMTAPTGTYTDLGGSGCVVVVS